jgi:tetratricopeptide (TPR) repeat protein
LKVSRVSLAIKVSLFLVFVVHFTAIAQITFDPPGPNQLNSDLRAVSSLIRVGEYPRALSFLERMRSSHGDDPRIMDLYKQVCKLAKLYPQLEELVEGELAKDPDNSHLLSDLGEAKFLLNDETGADSVWRMALETGKNDEMTYRLVADTRLRYGMYDAAIETYLLGRRTFRKNSLFSLELANIYEAQRDYERAIDEYIVQLFESPERIEMIFAKIRGLVEDSESPDLIIKTVSDRLEQHPGHPGLYEILGDLYIKQNQMDKALECYKTIGSKQNDDGQSLIRFAGRAYDSKAYAAAIAAIDEYSKVTKNGSFRDLALLTKARAQLAAGMFDEALGSFALLGNSPDNRVRDETGFSRGLIYAMHKGDCDSAIAVWNSMLGQARDAVWQNKARVEMAICNIKGNQYKKATETLELVATTKNPDPASGPIVERAIFLLGEIAFYSGDFEKANDKFRFLIRQFPNADYSNDALTRLDILTLAGDSASLPILSRFAEAMRAQLIGHPLEAAEILTDTSFALSQIAEQALYYSGLAFADGSSTERAMGILNSYIGKYPDGYFTDRAYLVLGDLYCADPATHPDARAAYNKILEMYPGGPVTEIARQKLRELETQGKIG